MFEIWSFSALFVYVLCMRALDISDFRETFDCICLLSMICHLFFICRRWSGWCHETWDKPSSHTTSLHRRWRATPAGHLVPHHYGSNGLPESPRHFSFLSRMVTQSTDNTFVRQAGYRCISFVCTLLAGIDVYSASQSHRSSWVLLFSGFLCFVFILDLHFSAVMILIYLIVEYSWYASTGFSYPFRIPVVA